MENVAYLEIEDFNSDGSLKPHVGRGKPVVLMAQGNFCGYCQKAKPDYLNFAKSNGNVVAASLEIDGSASEKQAANFLKQWDSTYRGVPWYGGFNSDGKFAGVHGGGRDTQSIIGFSTKLR